MNAPRHEIIHSMLRRLIGWDYRQRAIYQITVTLADRASQALGRLEVKGNGGGWVSVEVVRGMGLEPDEVVARVTPSEIGEIVLRCWAEIPRQWPGVSLIGAQLMPDHFHGIVFVERPQTKTLGNIIGSFKSKSSSRAGEVFAARGEARHGPGGGEARLVAGGGDEARAGVGGGCCSKPRAASLWSPGYQDTILFRDGQLANMKHYLVDNPRRLAVKRLFPELFRVVREWAVPLTLPGGVAGVGRFAAIGNRFLLERPLEQVQVSRRDFSYRREPKPGGGLKIARDAAGEPLTAFSSPLYAEKKELLFAAAKHGAVLISPCVSDGERQIAHEALAAGFPLVTLHNKGFAKLQKPSGRHFDACGEGRLLMLAPAAWPYQPGEKPMTRFDATAMNRLCQWLAGEGAAEINYHGMQPANVDELACAAARVERRS